MQKLILLVECWIYNYF